MKACIIIFNSAPIGQLTKAQTFFAAWGLRRAISDGRLFGRKKRAALVIWALLACLGMVMVSASAQTFRTLHSFTVMQAWRNSDGAQPFSQLLLSGDTLFGTAGAGGSQGNGTLFAVKTDGSGYTVLHDFVDYPSGGARPMAGLVLGGGRLFGTTRYAGSGDTGTVFAINTNGTGFSILHNFSPYSGEFSGNADGDLPLSKLLLSGSTLYGTAAKGGVTTNGTVYAVNTDGSDFRVLHHFTVTDSASQTNNDGAVPILGNLNLVISGETLFGTTSLGGHSGNGTVFAVKNDGTGFTNLHHFTAIAPSGTNSDGAYPLSGLLLCGDTLYGTASEGGTSGRGTVFVLKIDGTGFRTLHSFTEFGSGGGGGGPFSGLIAASEVLYGVGGGVIYALSMDGTGFTILYAFSAAVSGVNTDGVFPNTPIVSGNILYGTAMFGGAFGNGTIFSLSFAPKLTITPCTNGVILEWQTNYAGFDYSGYALQQAAAIADPFTNGAGASNPYTNPVSGGQQFYRLISN